MAKKIFGNKSPVGETLNLSTDGDLKVTGVVKNVPRNSHFPFRISLSLLTFAIAGLMALCIALMTVCYQSIKAALADPVNSIRYE
jgi:ABC-type lipoprotein release transport system permease subunit